MITFIESSWQIVMILLVCFISNIDSIYYLWMENLAYIYSRLSIGMKITVPLDRPYKKI